MDNQSMPEDIIAITRWGMGNYYLEDRETGHTIRITPDIYWDIVAKVQQIMKTAELNGIETRG